MPGYSENGTFYYGKTLTVGLTPSSASQPTIEEIVAAAREATDNTLPERELANARELSLKYINQTGDERVYPVKIPGENVTIGVAAEAMERAILQHGSTLTLSSFGNQVVGCNEDSIAGIYLSFLNYQDCRVRTEGVRRSIRPNLNNRTSVGLLMRILESEIVIPTGNERQVNAPLSELLQRNQHFVRFLTTGIALGTGIDATQREYIIVRTVQLLTMYFELPVKKQTLLRDAAKALLKS